MRSDRVIYNGMEMAAEWPVRIEAAQKIREYVIAGKAYGRIPYEEKPMKCRVCGGRLVATITDLPFKVTERTIVILKNLPIEQCQRCSEYLIEDSVFVKVEQRLSKVDTSVELEIVPFAA